VDPLVVASRLGKLVDLRLADGVPCTGERLLVHPVFELHQVVKDFHVYAFFKTLNLPSAVRGWRRCLSPPRL
jgi:hypothetical protein